MNKIHLKTIYSVKKNNQLQNLNSNNHFRKVKNLWKAIFKEASTAIIETLLLNLKDKAPIKYNFYDLITLIHKFSHQKLLPEIISNI